MQLALVRHGESLWNKLGLWTGWQDIELTEEGKKEAKKAAARLRGISFQAFYSSDLKRAVETLIIIKTELNVASLPYIENSSLKERNYGEFTGKNKWEIEKTVGPDRFRKIRRGWQEPIKGGETLKDVYKRVIPYFENEIKPKLVNGKNTLLVSHGNTIRALIKFLDNISDEAIEEVELVTGEIVIYDINSEGKVTNKIKKGDK